MHKLFQLDMSCFSAKQSSHTSHRRQIARGRAGGSVCLLESAGDHSVQRSSVGHIRGTSARKKHLIISHLQYHFMNYFLSGEEREGEKLSLKVTSEPAMSMRSKRIHSPVHQRVISPLPHCITFPSSAYSPNYSLKWSTPMGTSGTEMLTTHDPVMAGLKPPTIHMTAQHTNHYTTYLEENSVHNKHRDVLKQ